MSLRPVKATVIDDDAFRLLAFPYGGPIPHPDYPRGVDLDGQTFGPETDTKMGWLRKRDVDWHHGGDGTFKRGVIGKAVDPVEEEDGWWVTVWLDHGARRLDLIKRLAERGGQLFGSSETVQGTAMLRTVKGTIPWRPKTPGLITYWPYWRQTLSTSPQNTHSVLRPLKADLGDTTPAFWADLRHALDDLGATSHPTSGQGEDGAKAGRVLSAVNERELRDALASIGTSADRLNAVLAKLNKEN